MSPVAHGGVYTRWRGVRGVDTPTHKAGCTEPETTNLFCPDCGKLLERGALKTVRFEGFHGPANTSPRSEAFWETGDPACFDKSVPLEAVTAQYSETG